MPGAAPVAEPSGSRCPVLFGAEGSGSFVGWGLVGNGSASAAPSVPVGGNRTSLGKGTNKPAAALLQESQNGEGL